MANLLEMSQKNLKVILTTNIIINYNLQDISSLQKLKDNILKLQNISPDEKYKLKEFLFLYL